MAASFRDFLKKCREHGELVEKKVQLKDYLGSATKTIPAGRKADAAEGSLEELAEKILKTLAKSHRFFAEILELFPGEGYGRVARAIGWLNQKGKITQDGEGKYQVKGEI